MKRNSTKLFWFAIVLTTLISFGCGDNNSGTVAGDATVPPFGAETISSPMDSDGDGTWEMRLTLTYAYDSLGRVIQQTTTIEYDYDDDGTVDEKSVYTTTYDPDIQISEQQLGIPTMLVAASKVSGPSLAVGNAVITSSIEEDFELNSNNVLAVVYRSTSTYTYDTEGRRLSDTRVTESDTDSDLILDRIVTYSYTWSYNDNDDLLEYVFLNSTDADGDGTAESCSGSAETYTYDTVGNEISFLDEDIVDCAGTRVTTDQTTTTNSYDPVTGVLTQAVKTDGCTTDYTYDGTTGLLNQKERNCDFDNNYALDYRETTDYTYDSSDRIDSRTRTTQNFDNLTDSLTSKYVYSFTYVYDSQGRVTNETAVEKGDYSAPFIPLTPNYVYTTTYTYVYDTADRPVSYTRVQENDNTGSGSIDYEYANGVSFTYDPGHGQLTGTSSWNDGDNDQIYDSESTYTLSYDPDDRLISWVYNSYSNGSSSPDRTESRSGTYDETGRPSSYVLENDNDGDGIADTTNTATYSYNGLVATIATSSTSGPSGSIEVSFGANGIPTGATEMAFGGFQTRTPVLDEKGIESDYVEVTAPLPNMVYLFEGNQNSKN